MTRKTNNLNLPTVLTIFRIALVLPLTFLILQDNNLARIVALVCFIIASITDFLDGNLARRRHQVTKIGIFLDPLADKMLVNLTFLTLVYLNVVPLWIFAVILVRDFIVDGIRMMSAKDGVTMAASKLGKSKTMIQMFTLVFMILNLIIKNDILGTINTILLYIVLILTVLSGLDYLKKGRKQLIK